MEEEKDLEEFERYLREMNLAENTVVSYIASVRLYFNIFSDITRESLLKYRDHLIRNYKPTTVNQRIYALNHYIIFLDKRDQVALKDSDGNHKLKVMDNYNYIRNISTVASVNDSAYADSKHETFPVPRDQQDLQEKPPFTLPSVKVQRRTFLDSVISNEDYEHLKQCLRNDGNYFWYFVVRFLTATGARVSELLQIKVEHLYYGYLDLYSKGGKVRRIYFPDALCQEALKWCGEKGKGSGFFFLNKNGNRITARGIHYQLKHFAVKYGIDPDTVYPHSFRHRFAKNFLSQFNDIALLADLMGHESIETTRIYLTRSSREQKQLLDELITW